MFSVKLKVALRNLYFLNINKRANQYNQQIRSKIRGQENEISTGDFVMVVKNNYFWLKESSEAGFIANGDIAELVKINGYHELYGLRFADVNLCFWFMCIETEIL